MKTHFCLSTLLTGLLASTAFAQHSDVEFGYDNIANPTSIVIEENDVTAEGLLLFEGGFETPDVFNPNDIFVREPGFETNPGEGLLVGDGDQVWLMALDARNHSSVGAGFVNFYNPATGDIEAGGPIGVSNPGISAPAAVLSGTSVVSGDVNQFLAAGDANGDLHVDPKFDLINDNAAAPGAYGILLQLKSDIDADGDFEFESAPFWLVLNHDLDEDFFDDVALAAFSPTAIPEPASVVVISGLLGGLFLRRRRS